jgi:lysophospholipase L1-like esterase
VKTLSRSGLRIVGVLVLSEWLIAGCQSTPRNSLATHQSGRWESDIAAFEAQDRVSPPPKGCIVFVGSSSIRLWKTLAQDFEGLPVVNRGFGGSQIADAVNFADRIIIPYAPREVLIYAGTNDINAGKSPEMVYGDFVALIAKLRSRLPNARLAFISCQISPSRWNQLMSVRQFNAMAESYCHQHDVTFINTFPLLFGSDGRPRPDLFASDRLHMSEKGYAIWRETIGPYLR